MNSGGNDATAQSNQLVVSSRAWRALVVKTTHTSKQEHERHGPGRKRAQPNPRSIHGHC